jgi:hypothetical protein
MRTIILIAAMALTSVAAQAGESRGLSTAAAPAEAAVAMPTLQRQAQNDAPVAGASTPVVASAAPPARRYDDKGYFDDAGYHPSPRRYTSDDRPAEPPHRRSGRPHHGAQWSAQRIIAELHHYGIYW